MLYRWRFVLRVLLRIVTYHLQELTDLQMPHMCILLLVVKV